MGNRTDQRSLPVVPSDTLDARALPRARAAAIGPDDQLDP